MALYWSNRLAQIQRLRSSRLREKIITTLPEQRRRRHLHFKDLDHQQRVMALQTLSGKPFRSICVMVHKPSIDKENFKNKNQLYQYACRYLVERISWLCRDYRPHAREGDGRVQIIFDRRGGMSYDGFRDYLNNLRTQETQIHWPVIDVEAVEARDQSNSYGLQIADLVISGIAQGLEPDFYGNQEGRYARLIRDNIFRRGNRFLGYGIKIFPAHNELQLTDAQKEFISIFRGE